MSTSTKIQPARTNDSRNKLLAGASVCFLKSGFAATSLDDIAAECKVVKQTLYNHFPTKEALFHEAVDYLMQGLVINLDEGWLSDEPFEFFCKVGQLKFSLLQNRKMTDFLQLAVKESKSFPELQDIYSRAIPEPTLAFVSKYLEQRTAASKERCDVVAWAFRSAINGYATLYNTNQLAPSHPHPVNYVVDLARIFALLLPEISAPLKAIPTQNLIPSSITNESFAEELIFSDTTQKLTSNQMSILKAALKVFAEKGYIETTMLDVAAQANVSKQTVYKHFKSKDELYKTFCQTYLGRLCFKCEVLSQTQMPSGEIVLGGVQSLFALSSNDWFIRLFRTMISESYFFPVEANHALIFLFTLGHEIASGAPGDTNDFAVPEKTLKTSISLAIRSLTGNFVLAKQVFKLSGSVAVSESDVIDLLLRVTEMMSQTP